MPDGPAVSTRDHPNTLEYEPAPPPQEPRTIQSTLGRVGDLCWLALSGGAALVAGAPSTRWSFEWDVTATMIIVAGAALLAQLWVWVRRRPTTRWASAGFDLVFGTAFLLFAVRVTALLHSDPGFPKSRWRVETLWPGAIALGIAAVYGACWWLARHLRNGVGSNHSRP